MANPTEQELQDAYGDYSQINYEKDNVLRTAYSQEGDLTLLQGKTVGARLLKPQKKISFTKKDKDGRPLEITD